RAPLAARGGRRADQAAALARQVELRPPVADVAADALLADPVVDRRVDVVDARVEHGVEDALRLPVGHVPAARRAADLHGAVAQQGDVQARPSESSLGQRGHRVPPVGQLDFSVVTGRSRYRVGNTFFKFSILGKSLNTMYGYVGCLTRKSWWYP